MGGVNFEVQHLRARQAGWRSVWRRLHWVSGRRGFCGPVVEARGDVVDSGDSALLVAWNRLSVMTARQTKNFTLKMHCCLIEFVMFLVSLVF